METLSIADSEAHKYAGISRDLWEELKENHPNILRPCAQTGSGRKYFLKRDIEAALIANKSITANKPINHRETPPFLAHA